MNQVVVETRQARDFADHIESLASTSKYGPGDIDSNAGMTDAEIDLVLDRGELWNRLGGDPEFLNEIAQIFFDDCPGLLARVREGLRHGDAAAVARAAHAIKGSVGNFAARSAFNAALQLELMARTGNLSHAALAQATLEREIQRLQPVLTALGRS